MMRQEEPLDVLILASDPLSAGAVQTTLAGEAPPPRCRLSGGVPSLASLTRSPDVLILTPQDWQEMGRWLPDLRLFRGCRWLVRAQPRVAGMFLSVLKEAALCTITGSRAHPEEFLAAFRALTAGRSICPPPAFAQRLNRALQALPGRGHMPPLDERGLECGCAVSLGLSSPQIARVLLLSRGTVNNTLTGVYRTLGVRGRQNAGELIEQAVSTAFASD